MRSIEEEPADARLLAPTAMRRAVAETSEEKVKEYPSEVTVPQTIFDKLKSTPDIETPLDQQAAAGIGLSEAELSNLVKYGVFLRRTRSLRCQSYSGSVLDSAAKELVRTSSA
jgi:hypothetical protein